MTSQNVWLSKAGKARL